ncbi:MAG TPA: S8 family peptidase [Gemmatimonadaceae bacterium]|nr:S8 family peptidase [Gemmatimonadaceae bacterium]
MPAKKKTTAKRAAAARKSATTTREGDQLLESIGRGVVSPVLHDPERRATMGLPKDDEERGPYMIELNVQYQGGLAEAGKKFLELWTELFGGPRSARSGSVPSAPIPISKSYWGVQLSVREWRQLIENDAKMARNDERRRLIYKLWPDFKVKPLIDRSVATVKADAAYKAFSANGSGITWAVVDSGIDGTHPHFGSPADAEKSVLYHADVVELHRDFSNGADIDAQPKRMRGRLHPALVDEFGHGTHVAGIISGALPIESHQARAGERRRKRGQTYAVYEQVFESNTDGSPRPQRRPRERSVSEPSSLRGVAPGCLLVSLKVMDGMGNCRVSDVMRALAYVREQLNSAPKLLRVHGVNISIGYDFDAQMFACGQSPLCVEVDRLVRSGVVVVVAAGNTGYGEVAARARVAQVGLSNTINDPGNSELAITVGATHRDSPHTYGVSFFSSKGPTGDGRLKPDVVAPGERITSCASAGKCRELNINAPPGAATYVDDSGTSLAAPHVSGAIAAFLSVRREFIQRPEDVKRLFLSSATSLGRERYFEGNGLVDLMRAIQSV